MRLDRDLLQTLDRLVHLTALTLFKGKLNCIPLGLAALGELRILDLSFNAISARAVADYPWHRHLHLSALSLCVCGLEWLPEVLLELHTLKVGIGGGWVGHVSVCCCEGGWASGPSSEMGGPATDCLLRWHWRWHGTRAGRRSAAARLKEKKNLATYCRSRMEQEGFAAMPSPLPTAGPGHKGKRALGGSCWPGAKPAAAAVGRRCGLAIT